MFGKILKEYRLRKKMTQLELARKLGQNSAQYISNLERGVMPSITMAIVLSKKVGIPLPRLHGIFLREYKKHLKIKFSKHGVTL